MTGGDTLLQRFGARVRALRTERAWTLKELADRADLSIRFVSEIEAGRGNVSLTKLAGLAAAFGVDMADLLQERGSAPAVIALVGLRGAGKSTVGKRLADKLGLPFFELDALIESAAGVSLAEIFALHGDAFYRRLETATLERFFRENRTAVLATGGGIVTNADAFSMLRRSARVVWLKADPEDHWNRVVRQGDRRPMAANPRAKAELRQLLRSREPLYRQAHDVVDTSELGIPGTVDSLARTLRAQLAGTSFQIVPPSSSR